MEYFLIIELSKNLCQFAIVMNQLPRFEKLGLENYRFTCSELNSGF